MNSNIGIKTGMEDDSWCTAYAEQARKDVAHSLGVPQEYVLIGTNQTCSDWNVYMYLLVQIRPVLIGTCIQLKCS